MSADKTNEKTSLEETVAQRTDLLYKNIGDSKKQFIQNQAQVGLLHFLIEARNQLDTLEARMAAQLGKKRSSLFSFFTSSKKVVPAAPINDLSSEFETARRLLFEINEYILRNADETNLVERASRQRDTFESAIKTLKDGGRIERYWNDTKEAHLFSEEIAERKLLGTISKPKIFSILSEVRDELEIFPARVKDFLRTTHERVDEDIARHVDLALKEFSTSPLGNYIIILLDLKIKTGRLQRDSKPQASIDKNLKKIMLNVQAAKDGLGEVDLKKAEQIEKIGQFPKSKLDILIVALPDEKFNELIHQINKSIHMKDSNVEPQPAVHSRYRRNTHNS
jgi:hypothetical protein